MARVKKILKITFITLALFAITIYLFMQQASFGRLPSGERLERIKSSKHYKNEFVNFSPTTMLAEGASYFQVIRRSLTPDKKRTPSKPLPSVEASFVAVQGNKPVITWFGHSSYLVQANGLNILVDPVFSKRASFAQYIGPSAYPGTMTFSLDELPAIDIIIISHDHYDHLDYNTILQLKHTVKHYYVPLGVGAHLEHWGVERTAITELDWWEEARMPAGMHLAATPARHFSGRGFTRNQTLWASYVLNTGGSKIYIGGDSGYDAHFREIGERFGPFDLAILENGQYNENWPLIHMMPEQTVQACIDLGAKVLFPVHWGKFTLAVHAWNEPAIRVSQQAEKMNVQLTMPRIGEQIMIDSLYPSAKWWYF